MIRERLFELLQLSSWTGGWYEIWSGPTGMQVLRVHVSCMDGTNEKGGNRAENEGDA